jgi:hypothetical protein
MENHRQPARERGWPTSCGREPSGILQHGKYQRARSTPQNQTKTQHADSRPSTDTWIGAGLRIISLNFPDEIPALAQRYPEIDFGDHKGTQQKGAAAGGNDRHACPATRRDRWHHQRGHFLGSRFLEAR